MDAVVAGVNSEHWSALPPEAPLDMPVQSLRHRSELGRGPTQRPSTPRGMALRRLLVIGGAVVMTAAAANEIYKVLTAGALTALSMVVLLLFVAFFA